MNTNELNIIRKALEISNLDPDSEAMRAALKVLDEQQALNEVSISIIWQVDDVLSVRPDLTEDQAQEVLRIADHNHDANYGITWETFESIAWDLYGKAPEEDEEGEE